MVRKNRRAFAEKGKEDRAKKKGAEGGRSRSLAHPTGEEGSRIKIHRKLA